MRENGRTRKLSRGRRRSVSASSTRSPEMSLCNLYELLHNQGMSCKQLPLEFNTLCIKYIINSAQQILAAEPNCKQINSAAVLFGDLHGEFHTLVKLVHLLGRPQHQKYVFLGDFVDRGAHSLEVIVYLLLLKLLYPNNVILIRGNHEDRRIYQCFNFESDLVHHFKSTDGMELSSMFGKLFTYLPVCAVINNEIFCCHGGISPTFTHPKFARDQSELISKINEQQKPLQFKKYDFVCDLLWSDSIDACNLYMPNTDKAAYDTKAIDFLQTRIRSSTPMQQYQHQQHQQLSSQQRQHQHKQRQRNQHRSQYDYQHHDFEQHNSHQQIGRVSQDKIEWIVNPRGCSYMFTKAGCDRFLRKFKLRWLVRAHMFVPNGIRFEFDDTCITLFSAAAYAQRGNNLGAIIIVSGKSIDGKFPGRVISYDKTKLLKLKPEDYRADLPDNIV